MTGYKLLTTGGRSLTSEHKRVTYPLDGTWVSVPGNGTYIGLTVQGLLRGGFGPLLAEVEYEASAGAINDGEVVTARRVRVIRTVRIDPWTLVRVAIRAARLAAHH